MGNSPMSTYDGQRHFLIGDISKFQVGERRLFSISDLVLQHSQYKSKATESTNPRSVDTPSSWTNLQSGGSRVEESFRQSELTNSSVNQTCPFIVTPLEKPLPATQTYIGWKVQYEFSTFCSFCRRTKRTIYIQPIDLDDFPDFIKDLTIKLDNFPPLGLFGLLETFSSIFFHGLNVKVLPAVSLSERKWNITSRYHSVTAQKQYLVGDFYPKLQRVMPPDGIGIMGFIWTDLYPCEELNFVLGEVSYLRNAGMFCFGRYEPKSFNAETHSDITSVDAKFLWRLLKVFSHEVCHVLALAHCDHFRCAMNESSSIQEAFSQPMLLCPVCLRKLQHVCDFSVLHRYRLMHGFLTDLYKLYPLEEMKETIGTLQRCIDIVQGSA